MKLLGFALIGAMLLTSAMLAQMKVDVALVDIVATVTDDSGHYVADLKADDFILEEDGKPQEISHLTQSDDLPVSVGVVLDTSGSMDRKIATASSAVERFVRTIHADDDIFLMTFSDRPVLRQDFTSDRDKLAAALRRINVGGGTALYDALDESLRKIRKGSHDKKAILLITDGEDTNSFTNFDQAKLAVRESEILVYCVGIAPPPTSITDGNPPVLGGPSGRTNGGSSIPGIGFPGSGGRNPGGRGGSGGTISIPGVPIPIPIPGRRPNEFQGPQRRPQSAGGPGGGPQMNRDSVDMDVLNGFADASGGKAWLLSANWTEGRGNQIESILDEIASELRNQYNLGYYPSHSLSDGKWHRIDVRSKDKRYHVRARKEYFGK